MSDIQFVATNFFLQGGYVPYTDWFKLAELSGYEVIPISKMDVDDPSKCFVITPYNSEWTQGWPGAKARIIHYELEYRHEIAKPPGVSDVWCGDVYYANKLGMRYVPIGSHIGLTVHEDVPTFMSEHYDVALMCYRAPHRRAHIINQMRELNLSIAPDGWGVWRTINLFNSSCMVAIHQWQEWPCIAPLRMALAAAHKLALISETVIDKGMFAGLLPTLHYADMAALVAQAVRSPNSKLPELGEMLYQKLCVDYTFKRSIEAAL